MFELDIKFPYDSQLTVMVKDYGSLGNRNLIGKTTVDLEDRFYSSCYATCGLAKKYETEGYNKWRDALSPTQILTKMCKVWRLKRPDYKPDSLIMVTLEEQTIIYSLESLSDSDSEANVSASFPKRATNPFENSKPDTSPKVMREKLALMALNDWQTLTGVSACV
jgi:hypothetical protein